MQHIDVHHDCADIDDHDGLLAAAIGQLITSQRVSRLSGIRFHIHHHDFQPGLFCNDEGLAKALLEAADRSLDLAWRLPVHEEYGDSLRSNFADFANSGTRDGGASIGANFLSRFVDGFAWAHLDIAGVAWRANANKGATGRPVPLLVDYLLNLDGQ